LELRVTDNGCGFDPVARSTAGNGLTNLRQRIQDLGGTLDLNSSPGTGTQVELSAEKGRRKKEEGRRKMGDGRWEMGRS
jgi:signal transduction histidine kinase